MNKLKIVAFSDTHTLHSKIILPSADIAICAGDICNSGYKQEVVNFLNWYSKQSPTYKIWTAGNHDRWLEGASKEDVRELLDQYPNLTYLNDTSIEIEGIKIHGSPITPNFGYGWAFNRSRGNDIQKHWDLIPSDADIVVTHGPVNGYLDLAGRNSVGCEDLKKTLWKHSQNKIHICGHIHSGYGIQKDDNKLFINASVVNEQYKVVNIPTVFEFDSENKNVDI